MSTDKILLRDIFLIINKYKWKVLLLCVICTGFSIQTTNWMKKQFRSTFEINVYSKYFQNPLISTIVPGVYNIPEMRFTIDSMVKEAISDEFIDSIGHEFNFYTKDMDEMELARKRQFLRDSFSYYSTGGQSYEVSFVDQNPYVAKKVAAKTFKEVRDHFINSRIATIELVKEIMIKKLNSFNASQQISERGSNKVLASKSPDVLKAELKKINSDISALTKQYNEVHPKIVALKERKDTILEWLKEFEGLPGSDDNADVEDNQVSLNNDKSVSEQISGNFYTKFQNFNIALDIEKRSLDSYIGVIKKPQLPIHPIWPKKRLFASLGLIFGLVISFLYVFISEVLKPNKIENVHTEAKDMRTIVLGELPYLNKEITSNPVKQIAPYTEEIWSQ